mmetsp:Transcript_28111/g.82961  ORF Transcript_28111/g.82961 Transcript_28111/m.82961 type:complete len:238 (+) Transcript_28111:145-858(+)
MARCVSQQERKRARTHAAHASLQPRQLSLSVSLGLETHACRRKAKGLELRVSIPHPPPPLLLNHGLLSAASSAAFRPRLLPPPSSSAAPRLRVIEQVSHLQPAPRVPLIDSCRGLRSLHAVALPHRLGQVLAVVVAEPVELGVRVGAVPLHRREVERAAEELAVQPRQGKPEPGRRLGRAHQLVRVAPRRQPEPARQPRPAVRPHLGQPRARDASALVRYLDRHLVLAARDDDPDGG